MIRKFDNLDNVSNVEYITIPDTELEATQTIPGVASVDAWLEQRDRALGTVVVRGQGFDYHTVKLSVAERALLSSRSEEIMAAVLSETPEQRMAAEKAADEFFEIAERTARGECIQE